MTMKLRPTKVGILLPLVTALTALTALATITVPAGAAAAPYCGIRWGSLAKQVGSGPGFPPAPLVNLRAGRHDCYDRLVFDLDGKAAGGAARYVTEVTGNATGNPIPLRGGAFIDVTVFAPNHDVDGNPTYVPANPAELVDVNAFRTFRQVAWGESFEGTTTIGLGVRARLPFRLFVVPGPGARSRLVIDVAHRWS
jgi:hypothetical protein